MTESLTGVLDTTVELEAVVDKTVSMQARVDKTETSLVFIADGFQHYFWSLDFSKSKNSFYLGAI